MIDWYKFNYRDYRDETFGMADAEDLAYRRLIDLYYANEGRLPTDKAVLERIVALDYDCIDPVLKTFFQRLPDRWAHERMDKDIARRKAQAEQARAAGKRGGRPRAVVV